MPPSWRAIRCRTDWSTYQSEWAIDVVFRQAAVLRRLYPRLLQHGMTTFGSTDVLRFLGKATPGGAIPHTFTGELTTDVKRREEGVRIKHRVKQNSVKLYDKAFTSVGSVLRAETTIQAAGDFKVFRPREGDPDGPYGWRELRAGVADLYRRAEISRKATERYVDALASVDDDTTLGELVTRLGARTRWHGRPVRALRPLSDDRPLLEAISRGEFTLAGVRNRDLQAIFFVKPATTSQEARRRSAQRPSPRPPAAACVDGLRHQDPSTGIWSWCRRLVHAASAHRPTWRRLRVSHSPVPS